MTRHPYCPSAELTLPLKLDHIGKPFPPAFSFSQRVVYQPREEQYNDLLRCDLLYYYPLSLIVLHLIGMPFLLFAPHASLLSAQGCCRWCLHDCWCHAMGSPMMIYNVFFHISAVVYSLSVKSNAMHLGAAVVNSLTKNTTFTDTDHIRILSDKTIKEDDWGKKQD